jgi:hypothetical protein
VMGKETDDWSFQGKEVVGSNNGGDSFKLGNELAAGNSNGNNLWAGFDFNQLLHNFVSDLMNDWNQSWQPNQIGSNPYYNNSSSSNNLWSGNNYDRPQHQNQLRDAFKLFGQLFNVMSKLARLNDQMSTFRNRAIYA